jgi:hypothetical protein
MTTFIAVGKSSIQNLKSFFVKLTAYSLLLFHMEGSSNMLSYQDI